jgi:hypothetical protein
MERAGRLARNAGNHADGLRWAAQQRLRVWRDAAG